MRSRVKGNEEAQKSGRHRLVVSIHCLLVFLSEWNLHFLLRAEQDSEQTDSYPWHELLERHLNGNPVSTNELISQEDRKKGFGHHSKVTNRIVLDAGMYLGGWFKRRGVLRYKSMQYQDGR